MVHSTEKLTGISKAAILLISLWDHFTGCMSQRGTEMLRDDMDALGTVRIKNVEGAQQQIIAVIQELQAGRQFSAQGGGDQYVT